MFQKNLQESREFERIKIFLKKKNLYVQELKFVLSQNSNPMETLLKGFGPIVIWVWLAKKVISVLSTFFRSQLDGFCLQQQQLQQYVLCTILPRPLLSCSSTQTLFLQYILDPLTELHIFYRIMFSLFFWYIMGIEKTFKIIHG